MVDLSIVFRDCLPEGIPNTGWLIRILNHAQFFLVQYSHIILILFSYLYHDIPMIPMIFPWYSHDIPMVANKKIHSKDSHRWDVRAQGDSRRTGSQQGADGFSVNVPRLNSWGPRIMDWRWQFPWIINFIKRLWIPIIYQSQFPHIRTIYPIKKWIYHIPNYATNLFFYGCDMTKKNLSWEMSPMIDGECHLWNLYLSGDPRDCNPMLL
jgi:hypothetical protein